MSLTIEEICPKCGTEMDTLLIQSINCLDGKIRTMCPNCGYEKSNIDYVTYTSDGTATAYGDLNWNPYEHLIIETQNLQLLQTDLGLTIDVPFSTLCKIETIEINGIKFVKE